MQQAKVTNKLAILNIENNDLGKSRGLVLGTSPMLTDLVSLSRYILFRYGIHIASLD